MLFHVVTSYTDSLLSHIHVNIVGLIDIPCTLVATCVIWGRLECTSVRLIHPTYKIWSPIGLFPIHLKWPQVGQFMVFKANPGVKSIKKKLRVAYYLRSLIMDGRGVCSYIPSLLYDHPLNSQVHNTSWAKQGHVYTKVIRPWLWNDHVFGWDHTEVHGLQSKVYWKSPIFNVNTQIPIPHSIGPTFKSCPQKIHL